MVNIRRAMGSIAILALVLTGCGSPGEDSEDSTITLGVASLPIFAPVFVADEKGYFEDRGLDVELEFVQTGQDAIPLLSSGQMDALAAGFSAGVFTGLDEGLEFRIVGSMGVADGTDYAPAHLIVRDDLVDDGTVSSLEDLEGLDIGVAGGEGGTGAFLTAEALENAGLSITDVNLQNVGNPDMPAALENGSIDAGLMSAPFSENALNDETGESFWYPPEGTSGTGLMYGEHFLDQEESELLFEALAEAADELQGEARYSEENLNIVGDAIGQSGEDLQDVPLYTWYSDLAPLEDQLTAMESVWMEYGALTYDSPLDPDEYMDASYSEAIDSE